MHTGNTSLIKRTIVLILNIYIYILYIYLHIHSFSSDDEQGNISGILLIENKAGLKNKTIISQLQSRIVITLFPVDLAASGVFRLVLNQSGKCDYNPALVCFIQTRNIFLCVNLTPVD